MNISILVVLAAIFAVWIYHAFRILFHLRKRGQAKVGHAFPGPLTFLSVAKDWARDPETREMRVRFLIITIALFATNLYFSSQFVPVSGG